MNKENIRFIKVLLFGCEKPGKKSRKYKKKSSGVRCGEAIELEPNLLTNCGFHTNTFTSGGGKGGVRSPLPPPFLSFPTPP